MAMVVDGWVVVMDGGVVMWWCSGGGDEILLSTFAQPFHTDRGGGCADVCWVVGCK